MTIELKWLDTKWLKQCIQLWLQVADECLFFIVYDVIKPDLNICPPLRFPIQTLSKVRKQTIDVSKH